MGTPTPKINRLFASSSPKIGPDPSFDLHAFTQSPVKEDGKQLIVTPKVVQQKMVTRSKGKRKGKEISLGMSNEIASDSDFEDEIASPSSKKNKVDSGKTSNQKKENEVHIVLQKEVKKGQTSKRTRAKSKLKVREDVKLFQKKVEDDFKQLKQQLDKSILDILTEIKSSHGRQTENNEYEFFF
ncbi:uncharacterized protein LOC132629145 [Lycium barbarum]|uniref:uncharacterized protein LOC132629145 n=1 Tax=Lycium barbarum TaxID=112863 RepID=UPI00293E8463|nr:uncharacterized protein LOC132629145 [Lycium barbarum]